MPALDQSWRAALMFSAVTSWPPEQPPAARQAARMPSQRHGATAVVDHAGDSSSRMPESAEPLRSVVDVRRYRLRHAHARNRRPACLQNARRAVDLASPGRPDCSWRRLGPMPSGAQGPDHVRGVKHDAGQLGQGDQVEIVAGVKGPGGDRARIRTRPGSRLQTSRASASMGVLDCTTTRRLLVSAVAIEAACGSFTAGRPRPRLVKDSSIRPAGRGRCWSCSRQSPRSLVFEGKRIASGQAIGPSADEQGVKRQRTRPAAVVAALGMNACDQPGPLCSRNAKRLVDLASFPWAARRIAGRRARSSASHSGRHPAEWASTP